MPGGPDKDKIEEIRLKNRKGDPRTIKTPPSGIPKGPKPKPKPRPKGSNMQSYEPMGAGSRLIKAQKGDNLSTIAKRGGTTVKSIMNFNPNITNADKIREGQSIRVPAGTGMKKGGKVKGYKMGGALLELVALLAISGWSKLYAAILLSLLGIHDKAILLPIYTSVI